MEKPLVSVVLPVYNGEKHLKAAIDSMLIQSYQNLEVIVIIDGSKDGSAAITRAIGDDRIKLYENPQNLGLIGALNRGLSLAEGKYIARMDQDDLSRPERIQKQVEFMESNPDITVCGTNYRTFGAEEVDSDFPTSHSDICIGLHFESCIGHPTAMFRRQDLVKNNLQYPDFKDTEDWAMWFSIYQAGLKLANLKDILLDYRIEGQSTTPQDRKTRKEQFFKMYDYILNDLPGARTENDLELHWALKLGDVQLVNRQSISAYIKLIADKLQAKGFNSDDINKFINYKKIRLYCKFVDRSKLEGIRFMFQHGMFSMRNLRYLLASFKSKNKKN